MARDYRKYPDSYNDMIPYFNEFMDRYSPSHWMQQRNRIISFTLYLKDKREKKIETADVDDIIAFFKLINSKDLKRSTKKKWRNFLNAYYEFFKEIKEKIDKKAFINPVPSRNLFDFDEKEFTVKELEREEDLMTYPDIKRILNYLYFIDFRSFIIVSMLLYSGARISEICRIELENLDLEERYFITKIKSKKNLNRYGAYFFPKFFIKYLQEWINSLQEENVDPTFLFQQKDHHVNPKTPRKRLRDAKASLGLNCKMNPHAFRDYLNTLRFDQNIDEKYRFLLLNQTPENVNVKHYLKKYKKRKELLEIYDKTFPFPEFKPNLKLI